MADEEPKMVTKKTAEALQALIRKRLSIPDDVHLQLLQPLADRPKVGGLIIGQDAAKPGRGKDDPPPKEEILAAKEQLLQKGLVIPLLTHDSLRNATNTFYKSPNGFYETKVRFSDAAKSKDSIQAFFAFAETLGIKATSEFKTYVAEAGFKEDPDKVKAIRKQLDWNKQRIAEVQVAKFKGDARPTVTLYFADEASRSAALATLKDDYKDEHEGVKQGKSAKALRAKRPYWFAFPIKEGATAEQTDKIIHAIANPTSNYFVPDYNYKDALEKHTAPSKQAMAPRSNDADTALRTVLAVADLDAVPDAGGHGLSGKAMVKRETKSQGLKVL
jgi:hypothetical protein